MLVRIKVIDGAEQITCSVANASIGIGHAVQNFVRHCHLTAIVGGTHPQPDDISAQCFQQFLWCNDVAQ